MPKYMKPTVNNILKDNEVDRIKDDVLRYKKITEILSKHKEYLTNERENFKKLRWKRIKRENGKNGQKNDSKYDGNINSKNISHDQKIIDDENSKMDV